MPDTGGNSVQFICCLLLVLISCEFVSYRAFFAAQRPCWFLPGPLPLTTFHPVPFLTSGHGLQLKYYNLEVSFFSLLMPKLRS